MSLLDTGEKAEAEALEWEQAGNWAASLMERIVAGHCFAAEANSSDGAAAKAALHARAETNLRAASVACERLADVMAHESEVQQRLVVEARSGRNLRLIPGGDT